MEHQIVLKIVLSADGLLTTGALTYVGRQVAKAIAEVDDDFKKSYKMKIKALLDVKKQKGWPGNVVWPDEEE